jgi:galactokinase
MQDLINQIRSKFDEFFTKKPLLVRSPGRVNLIGEHTDYNEGFVLPGAIDKAIIMAIAKRDDKMLRIYAHNLNDHYQTSLDNIQKSVAGWPNYILGVVQQLQHANFEIHGFECVFGGNIPVAAGLSSSAALEGATSFALNKLFNLNLDNIQLVQIGQAAENQFVGVQCGIMDQFININGQEGKVIKLDCRSLEFDFFPLMTDDFKIVLCDTGVRRELSASEYNMRRKQCEKGVEILRKSDPSLNSLRDVSLFFLDQKGAELDETVYKRCKYVIEENLRVLNCCQDLKSGNYNSFGERMFLSHLGLRYEYEVSCQELDILVEIAQEYEGVLGARMMGAGFGGCTINLVKSEDIQNFSSKIQTEYLKRLNKEVNLYTCNIAQGVSEV